MNKKLSLALSVAAALGIGYIAYRKFLAPPRVHVISGDWLKEEMLVSINGNRHTLKKGMAIALGRPHTGYSVEIMESYVAEVGKLAASAVVLKKNGSIVKTIINR